MNRAERRRREREAGRPSTWIAQVSPKEAGVGQGGWLGEMDRHFCDGKYSVMIRTVHTPWGPVEHACIRNTGGTDIPWREKQRIKNELFGHERVAVEMFPAQSQLVDEAPMYHLWILPPGTTLPFGLTVA